MASSSELKSQDVADKAEILTSDPNITLMLINIKSKQIQIHIVVYLGL